jgi:hypothetical protein
MLPLELGKGIPGFRAEKFAFYFGSRKIKSVLSKLLVDIPHLVTKRAHCKITYRHLRLLVRYACVSVNETSCWVAAQPIIISIITL